MLNYNAKGTYTDPNGVDWIYYQDDVDLSIFYVVPQPTWVETNGQPDLKLVTYDTDGPTSGCGYVTFNTMLAVPDAVRTSIMATSISARFPAAPKPYLLNPMDFNPGCTAEFTLDVAGTSTSYLAKASEFGNNVAAFQVDLDKAGMATIQGLLTTAGGGFNITYNLNVPARLNAVTATLSFNSAIAYKYQVTHAQSHAYAASTPRSVQKLLTESSSSHIDLKWGITDPSQDLITTVTEWANGTIGALVSDEVNTALSLLKESSYDSFTINDVSSFSSVYASDQVVDWKLYPTGALPLVTDIGSHETTVSTRKQVMTVSTNLPFVGESVKGTNVPKVNAKPVAIKQLVAKVTYPGLPEKNSTATFTANGSHTFEAPYDATQGDAWDVSWTATYEDGTQQPVSGQETGINESNYSIALPSVGILSIAFDCGGAFLSADTGDAANAAATPKVTMIEIDFHFVDPKGAGAAIMHKQTLNAPSGAQDSTTVATPESQLVFTSYVAHNVITGTEYTYVVTYHFSTGPSFVGPQLSSTSYRETVGAPPAPTPTPFYLVAKEDGDGDKILGVDVDVWFETDQIIPGSGPHPTRDNPTTFHLVPASGSGDPKVLYATDTFTGYQNGYVPLMYGATITSIEGPVTVQPTRLAQDLSSVFVSAVERYTSIAVEMDAIDWATNGYDKITIVVTRDQVANTSTPGIGTNSLVYVPPVAGAPGHQAPRYVTYEHKLGESFGFTWIATYITSGVGSTTTSGTGTSNNPQIVVPATGTTPVKAPPSTPSLTAS